MQAWVPLPFLLLALCLTLCEFFFDPASLDLTIAFAQEFECPFVDPAPQIIVLVFSERKREREWIGKLGGNEARE